MKGESMRHVKIVFWGAVATVSVLGLSIFWMWPIETVEVTNDEPFAGPSLLASIVGLVFFVVVLVLLITGVVWLVNVCRRYKEVRG